VVLLVLLLVLLLILLLLPILLLGTPAVENVMGLVMVSRWWRR
jgi:hypothetical protein